jgi:predicted RNase H-like nuclease
MVTSGNLTQAFGTSIAMIILGLDAAWTPGEPSGVALVAREAGEWKCLCAAPSYDAFAGCSAGEPVDWGHGSFHGTVPNVVSLLKAAQRLAGAGPDVIAIDMPMSCEAFAGRRVADAAISTAFGARGCSTHSPSRDRPGPLGEALTKALGASGYPLATIADLPGTAPRTLEVYPHPALLVLLARDYRIPYKVSKSKKSWPQATVQERIRKLLEEFAAIESALSRAVGETQIPLPRPSEIHKLSQLKRYEDALDALISAWVGIQYIDGRSNAYGDGKAAIWVPAPPSVLQP